jgi:Ca2+-binding EF-hand superfamily protein
LVKIPPVKKAEKAADPAQAGQEKMAFEILDPNHDCYVKDATLRDVVTILYKKPVSQKEWLNEIIKEVTNPKH